MLRKPMQALRCEGIAYFEVVALMGVLSQRVM